ncbi:hypothetical protein HDU85_005926 [Gaertneriomyces sp. JEL0708]|nr:hypothetical protein HDU85_005926 [Gaertneriomyces sp. JEL0708]
MGKGDICINVEYHSPEGIERYSAYFDNASMVADVIRYVTDKYGNDVDVILMSATDSMEVVVNMSDSLISILSAGPLIVRIKKMYTPNPPPYMEEVLTIHPVREEQTIVNITAPGNSNVDVATPPAALSSIDSTTTSADGYGYKQPSKRKTPHMIASVFLLGGIILFVSIFLVVKKSNKTPSAPTDTPNAIPTVSMTGKLDIKAGPYSTYSDGFMYVANNDTISAYSVTNSALTTTYKARKCQEFMNPYVYRDGGLNLLGATCRDIGWYQIEWDLGTGNMVLDTWIESQHSQGIRINSTSIALAINVAVGIIHEGVHSPILHKFEKTANGRISYHKGTNTLYTTNSYTMIAYNLTTGAPNFVSGEEGNSRQSLQYTQPSPDGKWVAATLERYSIVQWTSSGTRVREYGSKGSPSTEYISFYITKDSEHIIIGSRDMKLTTFNATDGSMINQLDIDVIPNTIIDKGDDAFYVIPNDKPHVYEYKYN